MKHSTWGRRGAVPLTFALALLAGACSTPAPAPKPVPPPSPIESPGKKSVTVSVAESGASVVLERNQELLVRLPSPPRSRLEWAPVDLPSGVLVVRRAGYEQTAWSPGVEEGTAGTAYWQFVAQATGNAVLRFDLRQPHRLDPAVQTVSYSVTVK